MDGERLSELRKDKGLTQKDLAKILSVSENSISLYERNIITPDFIILKYFKSKYFKKWISMLILSLKCYTDFSDMITLLRNADMKQVRYVCDLLL